MVVDKSSVIGLKDNEIRIDFIIKASNMLIKLKNEAVSQAEYDKTNEMAKVIAVDFEEIKEILIGSKKHNDIIMENEGSSHAIGYQCKGVD